MNKYLYMQVLQGHYGYGFGWEDLCASESYMEVRQWKREYQENEGGRYRIIERRELNPEWKKLVDNLEDDYNNRNVNFGNGKVTVTCLCNQK